MAHGHRYSLNVTGSWKVEVNFNLICNERESLQMSIKITDVDAKKVQVKNSVKTNESIAKFLLNLTAVIVSVLFGFGRRRCNNFTDLKHFYKMLSFKIILYIKD